MYDEILAKVSPKWINYHLDNAPSNISELVNKFHVDKIYKELNLKLKELAEVESKIVNVPNVDNPVLSAILVELDTLRKNDKIIEIKKRIGYLYYSAERQKDVVYSKDIFVSRIYNSNICDRVASSGIPALAAKISFLAGIRNSEGEYVIHRDLTDYDDIYRAIDTIYRVMLDLEMLDEGKYTILLTSEQWVSLMSRIYDVSHLSNFTLKTTN